MKNKMNQNGNGAKVKPEDKLIYKGHLTLVQRPYLHINFDVVISPDAAIMLYIDDNDIAYLTKQYRPAVEEKVLSLPAETLDKNGKNPLEVMVEGLEEEVGIKIDSSQVTYVGRVISTDGHDTERVHLFLAHGKGEYVGQRLEDTENIEVVKIPFDELYKKVLSNEIEGSKTRELVLYEKLRRLGELK